MHATKINVAKARGLENWIRTNKQ